MTNTFPYDFYPRGVLTGTKNSGIVLKKKIALQTANKYKYFKAGNFVCKEW